MIEDAGLWITHSTMSNWETPPCQLEEMTKKGKWPASMLYYLYLYPPIETSTDGAN